MKEKKQILELLPKGHFIIHRENNTPVKGRFSMNVLDRFCEAKGKDNYLDLLEKITMGMSVGEYGELILMAIEDYFRGKEDECGFTKADVSDLVDEVFENGIADDGFSRLIHHAIGRVADIKKIEEAVAAASQVASASPRNDGEEKKSASGNSLTGGTSGSKRTRRG